jgi:hypothetical protein
MVLVTLDSLRSYARSLDERTKDTAKFSDSWIDSKINAAYEIIATAVQIFLKEDTVDLTEYINDGNYKFEIEFDNDIVGWKSAYYTRDGIYMYDYPIKTRFTVGDPVGILIKPDNKVIVDLAPDIRADMTHTIVFEYYYFPNTKTGDQYFSTDIYHMVRHAIASTVYDALRDYERRDNFDNQLARQIKTVVNGWDYDASNVRKGNWNI